MPTCSAISPISIRSGRAKASSTWDRSRRLPRTRLPWQTEAPRGSSPTSSRAARFTAILAAVREVAGEALVAAPGLTEAQAAELSSDRMRVFAGALNLDGILAAADLCVSHAGNGLAARALMAGVPLALLPMQLEQYLIARPSRRRGPP